MEDRREASQGATSSARGGSSDDPAAAAERLFARLTEGVEQGRSNGAVPDLPSLGSVGAPPDAAVDARQPRHPISPEPVGEGDPEVRDLVVAALAATDRIAEVVELLGVQADATTSNLAALGSAMEQALRATNDRLASLERSVLGEVAAGAEDAALAAARLRKVVERNSKRKETRSS